MPQVTGGDGPSTKSVPHADPEEVLLTTVSIFVENDCHERTTTSHIRGRTRRCHRPRALHPDRLLLRQRRRGHHGQVRRRRVVLPDGLPRRADRRRARPRHQSHRARPGTARPGDQRPSDGRAREVRRGPLPQGLQPAVDKAVGLAEVSTKIDAAELTTLETHGTEVGGHEDEHGDEHAHEGEHAHEDEHGHDHDHEGGADPHIWLDPVKYAEVAEGVGKAFQKADPDHAADYRKNTETLVGDLKALDKKFRTGLADRRTDVFLTTHAAFGYLAERYGLTEEAISGLDPESEPSGARMKELQEIAKADGVTTVFYETLVSDRTAKTLAADAGLKTDVLDPVEGITDHSRGEDYLQVMEANLTALRTALGAR